MARSLESIPTACACRSESHGGSGGRGTSLVASAAAGVSNRVNRRARMVQGCGAG